MFAVLLAGTSAHAGELTLSDAVARALEKNADLVVERESVQIADATVLRAEAVYEPSLRGEARLRERTDPVNSILSGAPPGELAPTTRTWQTSASLVQLLPTGGTVSVFSGVNRDETDSVFALLTPAWGTSFGAEVRQPLMQNRRIDPARRAIRIARADRSRALSTLRRIAAETTAAVERSWWNLAAARRDAETRQSAVRVAEKQREDTKVRIEAGTRPEAELAHTTAEVERRKGDLAVAQENVTRAENTLRALIARDTNDEIWSQELVPDLDAPDAQASTPQQPATSNQQQAPALIATALENRPELEELQQRLTRQDIELESSLDRIRPQVDLVASYNTRGLSGTRNENAIEPFGPVVIAGDLLGGLGSSLGTLARNQFPDASLGVAFTIPIGNVAAKQDVAIARAVRRQSEATLDSARQRIAVEVRNALASLASAEQRIDAARAARVAAETGVQAERDRFEAGTSNTFFILTRQNELASAQLAETVALSDYRKAQTELARATGTLLRDRNIIIER
ncbi:MAG TPA: TolC family protein [Thermoanaerobaculia bacterium]|nr:TolC family protein [Thermoanaerobaculia bacterium]